MTKKNNSNICEEDGHLVEWSSLALRRALGFSIWKSLQN
jgi:hypothetical protein